MTTTPPDSSTLSPELIAALQTEARAGLIFASQHEESGLMGQDHQTIRSRVMGISVASNGQPQVRVDSTGLNLDQKIFVERALLRHLDHNLHPDALIYFQKASGVSATKTGGAEAKDTSPAPIKRKSPFGLNIEPRAIPGVKSIIVVASGKGGVGKSTVSTNLAAGLARLGLKTGLMDCDIYGPSSPVMLGVSGPMPVEHGKLVPLEGHGVKVVSFGFLTDVKTPVIWRGPMVAKAITQLCYDVNWGDLDVLVLDLPPGTGDVQLTLAEQIPVTGSVIVTTPQDIALIDAHKAVSMFEKLGVPVLGVVENMSHYTCSACGHEDHIFGHESFLRFLKDRGLRLLTRIPLSREIRELSDAGTPVVLKNHENGAPYRALATYIQQQISPNHSHVTGTLTNTKDSHI